MIEPSSVNGGGASQVDIAYQQIRYWITSCSLRPGQRVHLRQLLDETGLGRTPVREALLRLEQDGLIIAIPRSAYQVTPLSRKRIHDFFVVWRALCPLIFQMAAENLDQKSIKKIERIIAPVGRKNLSPLIRCKIGAELFEVLAALAGNEQLAHFNHRLTAEMERLFLILFESGESVPAIFDTKEPTMEILKSKDSKEIARSILSALSIAEAGILAAFDSDPKRFGHVPDADKSRSLRRSAL
ncbi:MAG: GntR family transcriptional regulator [Parvularculaceae bacterium]|nr:GntR family transcriptional regulator [Parvularculaceae bacterium]